MNGSVSIVESLPATRRRRIHLPFPRNHRVAGLTVYYSHQPSLFLACRLMNGAQMAMFLHVLCVNKNNDSPPFTYIQMGASAAVRAGTRLTHLC